jgi:hypothetical protein
MLVDNTKSVLEMDRYMMSVRKTLAKFSATWQLFLCFGFFHNFEKSKKKRKKLGKISQFEEKKRNRLQVYIFKMMME